MKLSLLQDSILSFIPPAKPHLSSWIERIFWFGNQLFFLLLKETSFNLTSMAEALFHLSRSLSLLVHQCYGQTQIMKNGLPLIVCSLDGSVIPWRKKSVLSCFIVALHLSYGLVLRLLLVSFQNCELWYFNLIFTIWGWMNTWPKWKL